MTRRLSKCGSCKVSALPRTDGPLERPDAPALLSRFLFPLCRCPCLHLIGFRYVARCSVYADIWRESLVICFFYANRPEFPSGDPDRVRPEVRVPQTDAGSRSELPQQSKVNGEKNGITHVVRVVRSLSTIIRNESFLHLLKTRARCLLAHFIRACRMGKPKFTASPLSGYDA